MRRTLLAMCAAAAGLSLAATVADARGMGAGIHGSAGVGVMHSHANAMVGARAQVGPHFRPPGWSHGRKTGWHCRVGASGCIPPGLRP